MEFREELIQLHDSVDKATSDTQAQLNNVGGILLPISIASFAAAIGLQWVFKLLMLWIPTSFVLWILWVCWSIVDQIWKYISMNRAVLFRKYNKLNMRQKQMGQETLIKRLIPLSQALAVVYIVSAIILVLAKSGILSFNNFSSWIPLSTDLLLIVFIVGGPILYRHLSISDINSVTKLANNKEKLDSLVKAHPLRVSFLFLALIALFIFTYFVLPIWALSSSWTLFHSDVNWYKIIIVLVLQVLSFLVLSGYLTQQAAKTELSNNLSDLSGIKFRINQLLSTDNISTKDISGLEAQYYRAIRYRFKQERMLGFIPIYMPVLNEAFINSDTK
jgi:hypothetical protein